MRLIDADDVIETISHYLGKALYASYPNDKMPDFVKGMIDGYARARSIVLETPTAYPVQHGRWIIDTKFGADVMSGEQMVICSVCGRGIFWGKQNYCPNCGATMDEVSE